MVSRPEDSNVSWQSSKPPLHLLFNGFDKFSSCILTVDFAFVSGYTTTAAYY